MCSTNTGDKESGTRGGSFSVTHAYNMIQTEYDALTDGVGLLDRSDVGRLSVLGEESLDLLNRLSTNELMGMEFGAGVSTILTSNKGRIIDLLEVFRRRKDVLVMTSPGACGKVMDWIKFYTIMEDVEVKDLTDETVLFSVVGPEAENLLSQVFDEDVSSLKQHDFIQVNVSGTSADIYRTDFVRLPGYDIIGGVDAGRNLWRELLNIGRNFGIKTVGSAAMEMVRVEMCVPIFGAELTEQYNPLEADLLNLISFTKGCYIGQEVIARLNTYQKVQKSLVGLRWSNPDVSLARESKLTRAGKEVGVITSISRNLNFDGGLGLGYVDARQAEVGLVFEVESDRGNVEVEVIQPRGLAKAQRAYG